MDTSGMRPLDQLMIGYDLLQWVQAEAVKRAALARAGVAHEAGWVGEFVGPFANFGWSIYHTSGGQLGVRSEHDAVASPFPIDRTRNAQLPILGIDRYGNGIEVDATDVLRDDAGDPIEIPDDNTWYTLVARYHLQQRERGRLTLVGGSTMVVGTETEFLRYTDSSGVEPTILRIATDDTGSGNEGDYTIDSITDDENMVLTSAPPASETGVRFRVKGQFFSGEPADPDCHNVAVAAWELIARTTSRQSDGALIAADVKRNGGTVTIMHRLRANMYMPYAGDNPGLALHPVLITRHAGSPAVDRAMDRVNFVTAAGDDDNMTVQGVSLAPSASGSHLAGQAADNATGALAAACFETAAVTRRIRVMEWTANHHDGNFGRWDDPDNAGAAVDVVIAAGLRDVALIAIPSDSGNTHVCFYIDSAGSIQMKTSADNGATWVGPTLVWNPAGEEMHKLGAVLTRMNKIVIVAKSDSVGASIKGIYSHDLGTTWDLNGGVGYAIGNPATADVNDVDVVEDDRGNLWTFVAVDNANGLQLFRGEAEGSVVPSATEQSTGWKVGPDAVGATLATVKTVTAFAQPGGILGAFIDPQDAGAGVGDVYCMTIARRNGMSLQLAIESANQFGMAAGNNFAVPMGCCVLSNGMIMLVHHYEDGAAAMGYEAVPFIPTSIRRSHTFYGGL